MGPSEKLRAATRYLGTDDAARVCVNALDFAARAHEGQRRKSGEPYIIHPIEVACVLAELKLDSETIIAALLHDVVEDTDRTLDDIRAEFGDAVASIVSGVTDESASDADNQRALLLAMGTEWRVALVKLADRLHNMRTLEVRAWLPLTCHITQRHQCLAAIAHSGLAPSPCAAHA